MANPISSLAQVYKDNMGLINSAAALGVLSSVLGYQRRADDDRYQNDIDVDIPDPDELRDLAEDYRSKRENREEGDAGLKPKEAQFDLGLGDDYNTAAYYSLMALAPLAGFGAGRYLGGNLRRSKEEELKKARREYEKALLREQLAAMDAGRSENMQSFMPKQAQSESFLETLATPLSWVKTPYMAYAGPAATLAGLIGYDYFNEQNAKTKQYNKAKDLVEKRLSATVPRARLVSLGSDQDDDEEDRLDRRELLAEILEEAKSSE